MPSKPVMHEIDVSSNRIHSVETVSQSHVQCIRCHVKLAVQMGFSLDFGLFNTKIYPCNRETVLNDFRRGPCQLFG